MVRNSYTAIVERNREFNGNFVTEPYEVGWASELIVFVRLLEGDSSGKVYVEISPDGIHWCKEGTSWKLTDESDGITFCKLSNFGNWVRLSGEANGSFKCTVVYSMKE